MYLSIFLSISLSTFLSVGVNKRARQQWCLSPPPDINPLAGEPRNIQAATHETAQQEMRLATLDAILILGSHMA